MTCAIAALQAQGLVELTWLSGQTADDLQRAMRRGPWHILHFIGHGSFDAVREEGLLFLADAAGNAAPLYATQLARLLAPQRHALRLVLLNACEGARSGQVDLFASTAATLVGSGLLAVLAMQYTITDEAAVDFARTFYEALADNLPVDSAVADARNAMTLSNRFSLEWGTPVLYLRATDGNLFNMTKIDERQLAVTQQPIEDPIPLQFEQSTQSTQTSMLNIDDAEPSLEQQFVTDFVAESVTNNKSTITGKPLLPLQGAEGKRLSLQELVTYDIPRQQAKTTRSIWIMWISIVIIASLGLFTLTRSLMWQTEHGRSQGITAKATEQGMTAVYTNTPSQIEQVVNNLREITNSPTIEGEYLNMVVIISPVEGEIVSGIVTVEGSVNIPEFSSCEMQFGISHDPGAFSPPISGPFGSLVIQGTLGQWDTRGLEDGPHTLRLLARSTDGKDYEDRVRVFVAHDTSTPNR